VERKKHRKPLFLRHFAGKELDLEMKAMANCEVKDDEPKRPWREDKGLMEFLRILNGQAQQRPPLQ
jgi:hypothetical protein